MRQFQTWFGAALDADVPTPDAVVLATAAADGRPSARMVLLKGLEAGELRFFTGYASRKADELAANPCAALLWYAQPQGRQVRVEGRVERLAAADSDAYFGSRPLESRLAAWASEQSAPIAGRDVLEAAFAGAGARFAAGDVPRPERWGGYRLQPEAFEFWQHGDHRLHDRFRYEHGPGGAWRIERLAP